jgi:hypothetical protein
MTDVEKLEAELRAGLKGVTAGPWRSVRHIDDERGRDFDGYVVQEMRVRGDGRISGELVSGDLNGMAESDANHLARCSPDNIRVLLDELSRLRAERDDQIAAARRDALEEAARVAEARFTTDTVTKNQKGEPYLTGSAAIYAARHIAAAIRELKDADHG